MIGAFGNEHLTASRNRCSIDTVRHRWGATFEARAKIIRKIGRGLIAAVHIRLT